MVLAALALAVPAAASAEAPDPGGDENAQLSGPPPGKDFGFSIGDVTLQGLDATTYAGLVEATAGNTVRVPLDWWHLEARRDEWNEPYFDYLLGLYRDFLAHGITTHFTITSSPPWSRDPGPPQSCTDPAACKYPPAREMLDEWQEFVVEAVRRFPEATIEVWNEPNIIGNWRGGVDPARWAELVAAAHEAAKAEDDSTKLLAGGIAAGKPKPYSLGLREFLDRAYAASPSLKGHTDAINLHSYSGANLGAGSDFAEAFHDAREIRAKHADEKTPLYLSETGSSTTGPYAVGEREHAARILKRVRRALTMPDVEGALVNTLIDRRQFPSTDTNRGYGMLFAGAQPLQPKHAYCELVRATGRDYGPCPPIAKIESGPDGPTNQTSPEFSFVAGEEGAIFECSVDGGLYLPCMSPQRYLFLGEGAHTFAVRARDLEGNVDHEPDRRSFVIDLTPPQTSMSGPRGQINDATPVFSFSSPTPGVRFECSLDGEEFAACTSPHELGPLRDGNHSFQARAVDAAGNPDTTPASSTFVVDTRAPEITDVSGPTETTDTTPTFEFAADEPATFKCRFDDRSFTTCSGGTSHTPSTALGQGAHRFEVRATDAAGNTGASSSRDFVIDLTGPTTRITAPPNPIADSTPTFELDAGEEGATFECRIDGGAYASCPASFTTPELPDEAHELYVRARDRLGNLGRVAYHWFKIDTS